MHFRKIPLRADWGQGLVVAKDGLTEGRAERQCRTHRDQLEDRGRWDWVRHGEISFQCGSIRSMEGALCEQASPLLPPPPHLPSGQEAGRELPDFREGSANPEAPPWIPREAPLT